MKLILFHETSSKLARNLLITLIPCSFHGGNQKYFLDFPEYDIKLQSIQTAQANKSTGGKKTTMG